MDGMKKVLIADDERLVRIGLMHMVDWERWNLKLVADAPNGEVAWHLYLEHKPDLVITDIVMPGLDGIELTQRIKEVNPEAKILFLSCHSDFSYARQGMELGASGYLLKTDMDVREVERYLQKITAEWNRTAQTGKDNLDILYASWLKDGSGGSALNRRIGELLGTEGGDEAVLIGLFGIHDEEQQSAWIRRVGEEMAGYAHAVLNAPEAPLFHITSLKGAERLTMLLLERHGSQAGTLWKRRTLTGDQPDYMGEAGKMMRTAELESRYEVRTEAISQPIMQAVRFIDEHLHEPIVSSQVAGQVGLSRSHFSTMFKKEVGVSFLDFLHRRRMDKATELLSGTDWRIHKIGEMVGIEDNRHFSKWFKRYTGMTPSEFRENKLTTGSDNSASQAD